VSGGSGKGGKGGRKQKGSEADMDDSQLERIAARLGSRAAGALNVERVADRVIARLRSEPAPTRSVPLRRWLAIAAGLVILLGGSVLLTRHPRVDAPEVQAVAVTPTLDVLSDAELTEVLDSLSWEAPASAQLAMTLDDLDATQLQELLALMEG
jgi:hypothetical protein